MIEGSLEVKLPTIWTDEKQSRAEAERRERLEEGRVRRKKMQMREKVGKSRNTVFIQWFEAPEGRKVGSLKRRVRSQLARWEMKNCTPLWREAHFEVKMYKTHHGRTTFGSCNVEKVHAVVARSTFWSQNVQNIPGPDHFWKLRCRKSARRCGAKHISKSKCTRHTSSGPLLAVEVLKKCTPLWREGHFEVKMLKTPGVRTTFGASDVGKVHAVVARRTFRSKNVKNTTRSDHFWRFRCRFASIHDTTGHYTTLHSSTLHYTTLHSSTIHYIKLHYTTLHYGTHAAMRTAALLTARSASDRSGHDTCQPVCLFWLHDDALEHLYFIASPASCLSFLTARWCLLAQRQLKILVRCCLEKNTLRRHREGDTSEGCARFLHVFVVCCVNTVGAVEVSMQEYEDRISTR